MPPCASTHHSCDSHRPSAPIAVNNQSIETLVLSILRPPPIHNKQPTPSPTNQPTTAKNHLPTPPSQRRLSPQLGKPKPLFPQPFRPAIPSNPPKEARACSSPRISQRQQLLSHRFAIGAKPKALLRAFCGFVISANASCLNAAIHFPCFAHPGDSKTAEA